MKFHKKVKAWGSNFWKKSPKHFSMPNEKKSPLFCFGVFFFFPKHLPQIASSVTWYRKEVSFQLYSIWRFWRKHVMWVQIPQVIFPYMKVVLRQLRKIICESRGGNTAFPHINLFSWALQLQNFWNALSFCFVFSLKSQPYYLKINSFQTKFAFYIDKLL